MVQCHLHRVWRGVVCDKEGVVWCGVLYYTVMYLVMCGVQEK